MIPHKCPVCNGAGTISGPPYVAGDQPTWGDSGTQPYPCPACEETGIIWEPSLSSPEPVPAERR